PAATSARSLHDALPIELLRRLHPDGATLDAVGEVIGAQAVGMEHIEALLDALEAEGLAAREVLVPDLSATLRTVLRAARELRARSEEHTSELQSRENLV